MLAALTIIEKSWEVLPWPVVALFTVKIIFILILSYKLKLSKIATKFNSFHQLKVDFNQTPSVCIQLPVYNEKSNIVPLIIKIIEMDWPKDRLEIQILDDSNDETSMLIRNCLSNLIDREINIHHLRRSERKGYKAGALNYGLSKTNCDFVAIFDADFRPESCFLRKTIPHFIEDQRITMVQTPWAFANVETNNLTKIQSLMLNSHFKFDHKSRFIRGMFFNFNGTAGIWKTEFLKNQGGWSDHSVTEDLYISLKGYLRDEKFKFVDDVSCLSMLPSTLGSFSIQQKRWAKGNAQVFRLLADKVVKSRNLSWKKKFDIFFHLLGYSFSTVFIFTLVISPFFISSISRWLLQTSYYDVFRTLGTLMWAYLIYLFLSYYGHKDLYPLENLNKLRRSFRAIKLFFYFPTISIIVIRSFWQGIFHKPKENKHLVFERTPKDDEPSKLNFLDRLLVFLAIIGYSVNMYFSILHQLYATSFVFLGLLLAALNMVNLQFKGFWFKSSINLQKQKIKI